MKVLIRYRGIGGALLRLSITFLIKYYEPNMEFLFNLKIF